MITSSSHGGLKTAEDSLAIMLHFAGFAVHQVWRTHYVASEGRSNRLVSEANAEDWHFAGEIPDQWNRDTGLLWGAGSGRKHNPIRIHGFHLSRRDLVVTPHLDLYAQLTQVLDEVIGE